MSEREQQSHSSKAHTPKESATPDREAIDVSPQPATVDRIWAAKGWDNSVTPVLHGLHHNLERTLGALDVEHDTRAHRQQLVDAAAQELSDASKILGALLEAVPKAQWPSYQAKFERVAGTINRLVRFIRTRTPHKEIETHFMVGVAEFDAVLVRVGSEPLASRTAAPLSERATHAGELETAEVQTAQFSVTTALKAMQERQHQAVTDFYNQAKLEDREQPPFIEELLKALLAAAAIEFSEVFFAMALTKGLAKEGGHLAGAAHRARAGHDPEGALHLEHAAHAIGDKAERRELLVKFFTASTEATVELAKQGGEGGSKEGTGKQREGEIKVDRKQLALSKFMSGLQIGIGNKFRGYNNTLNRIVTESSASASDLQYMAATFDASLASVHDRCLVASTKKWATYLSQARLGTHFAGNTKVSNMRDYFGKREGAGHEFGTDRSGGDGVLRVVFDVDAPGERPQLADEHTEVIGVNSVLKNMILRDADHKFANVALPKEVVLRHRFAQATIALDETNRIRDVRNWQEIEQYVGETAFQFWSHRGKALEVR